ncbi:MAG: hypothetical protein U0Q16_01990 [Bryobacteraceae bacterium]
MKLGMMLLFSAALCLAQEPKREVKLIKLQYASGDAVYTMLSSVAQKNHFGLVDRHTIVLNAPAENVAMMEALIKQLDTPAAPVRNVEITAYMLLGVSQAGEASVPADLAPVVKQLRDIFPFTGYRLLETMQIRTQEGKGGETSGLMPGPSSTPAVAPVIYQCKFNSATIADSSNGRRVLLDHLKFGTKVPFSTGDGKYNYYDLGANVDSVSVREGQKAVIGKAGIGAGKESLFLVLNAKVVD